MCGRVLYVGIHAPDLLSNSSVADLSYHILFFRCFLIGNNELSLVLCKNVFILSLYGLLGQTGKVSKANAL